MAFADEFDDEFEFERHGPCGESRNHRPPPLSQQAMARRLLTAGGMLVALLLAPAAGGSPALPRLSIAPSSFRLTGPHAQQQLLVTERAPDGRMSERPAA